MEGRHNSESENNHFWQQISIYLGHVFGPQILETALFTKHTILILIRQRIESELPLIFGICTFFRHFCQLFACIAALIRCLHQRNRSKKVEIPKEEKHKGIETFQEKRIFLEKSRASSHRKPFQIWYRRLRHWSWVYDFRRSTRQKRRADRVGIEISAQGGEAIRQYQLQILDETMIDASARLIPWRKEIYQSNWSAQTITDFESFCWISRARELVMLTSEFWHWYKTSGRCQTQSSQTSHQNSWHISTLYRALRYRKHILTRLQMTT